MTAVAEAPVYRLTPGRCGSGTAFNSPPCGTSPARLFPAGWRCETHAPSRPNGDTHG